jgi:hypothetical protein
MPIAVIADSLLSGKSLRLHSNCHDRYWTATFTEREQLRKTLAALNIEPNTHQDLPDAEQVCAAC